jgi:hypothetical protein
MGDKFFLSKEYHILRCLLLFAQSIVYDKNAINFFLVLNINSFIIFNRKKVIL